MVKIVSVNGAFSALYWGFLVSIVVLHSRQVCSAGRNDESFAKNVGTFGTVQNGENGKMEIFASKTKETDGHTSMQKREDSPEERAYVEPKSELKFRSLVSGEFYDVRRWQSRKRSIQRRHFAPVGSYKFVDIPRNEQQRDKISFAVKLTKKMEGDNTQVLILSVASVAVMVVVVVACLHVPCHCLKGRYKSDLDLDDLIGCPNPTAHDGKCGKCLFDRAYRKRSKKPKFGFGRDSRPASMGTNEELFLASENMYTAPPPWMTDFGMGSAPELPKPKKKSRSIVQTILRRSRSRDKFRYEFLAAKYGYNYKTFQHPDSKRSSIYDENEPDWYSAGEFLNRQSARHKAQRSYGTNDPRGKSCSHGCFKFTSKSANQSVEDIMRSKPRRRQVVELQEFPIGFSDHYGEEKCYKDKDAVFDPSMHSQMKRSTSGPCCHSETNLDSFYSQFDQSTKQRHSVDDGRSSRKSSMKSEESSSPRSSAKLVHFYPSSFDYETSFIQGSGGGKIPCERHRKLIGKEAGPDDQHLNDDTSSSSDLMSFDEDEDNADGAFDYSQNMVHYRPYQKHLHGFNSYSEMPQYSYYTNPQSRMRRSVRSETELRRPNEASFGPSPPRKTRLHSRRPVCSSDTTLNRTHVLKELTSAGLAKPCRKKAASKAIKRDARLDPLVGKISPMIKNKDYTVKQKPGKPIQEKSTVVQMPDNTCKEVIVKEHSQEKARVNSRKLEAEEPVDEGSTIDYRHIPQDVDPKYLQKTTHLQDEPVRDTDSEDPDGHMTSNSTVPTAVKYQSSLVHCHETGLESKTREELLVTPQQASSY